MSDYKQPPIAGPSTRSNPQRTKPVDVGPDGVRPEEEETKTPATEKKPEPKQEPKHAGKKPSTDDDD